jgi:drug/metabolite transporter (DMT)-like permease
MNRRYGLMLIVLALIWGSSFMFIKVAVRQLDPATLILGRLGLAALTLGVVVPVLIGVRETMNELRAHWPALALVGLLNTAVPFWLLSWGETRIDSGLASIIQASVPIFNALLAFAFFHDQRVTGRALVGVAVGFVGVALLVGAQPQAKILGALAVVGMATCYAIGGLLTRRYLGAARPQVVALGTSAIAALAVLPFGVLQAPSHVPGWKTLASVAVLGVLGTAVAYLLFFTIIAGAGAAYASLVTYLVPPVALAYGAIFLGESVGAAALIGLVLIFGGVTLGTRGGRRKASPSIGDPLIASAAPEP